MSQISLQQSASAILTESARGRLAKFLATAPSAPAIEEFFTALVYEFGSAVSAIAAEYYDARRAESPRGAAFRAVVVDAPPEGEIAKAIAWARADREGPAMAPERLDDLDDLAPRDLDGLDESVRMKTWRPPTTVEVGQRLDLKVSTLILRPGRDTITASVAADPAQPYWIRRPGPGACAFCLMLAGRSADHYRSAQSAGYVVGRPRTARQIFNEEPIKTRGSREVGQKYHDNCGCVPEPVWPGDDPPFDPTPYRQMYAEAVEEVGDAKSTAAVLAAMRAAHGLR